MTETGKVLKINGNNIVVAPDKSIACFGCMNMECRSKGGFITAENSLALPLEPGQIVEVSVSGSSLLRQAMAALLPPALGFIAAYTILRFFFPKAGEAAAAGLGVILFFTFAFLIYKAREKVPVTKAYSVTKIIA